jgi:trimethylamine--corrinoid protein Co-methyltransferase
MHASLLGFSLESLVIDNDIIGAVQRTIRSIDVTDESISLETIRQTCLEGPGHYLGSDQTLQLMQRDYVYPLVGDRMSPKEWVEKGRPNILDRAIRRVRETLDQHFPDHVSPAIDDAIRAKFPVRLPRESMRPHATEAAE